MINYTIQPILLSWLKYIQTIAYKENYKSRRAFLSKIDANKCRYRIRNRELLIFVSSVLSPCSSKPSMTSLCVIRWARRSAIIKATMCNQFLVPFYRSLLFNLIEQTSVYPFDRFGWTFWIIGLGFLSGAPWLFFFHLLHLRCY